MEIGRILQANQPDAFANMKRRNQENKNSKKKRKEEVDFKKLMERADTYVRGKGGALKRRR